MKLSSSGYCFRTFNPWTLYAGVVELKLLQSSEENYVNLYLNILFALSLRVEDFS